MDTWVFTKTRKPDLDLSRPWDSNRPVHRKQGTMTTKGRMEYQFKTFGGITAIVIEAKLNADNSAKRLNCFARAIAEHEDSLERIPYSHSTWAVLCAGGHFYFFRSRSLAQVAP
jgi:hypothetical protein